MDEDFSVVTNPDEIRKFNSKLRERLAMDCRHKEHRDVGYPGGHFTGSVCFRKSRGSNVPGWVQRNHESSYVNFLFFGDPGADTRLVITVQLNFPRGLYKRSFAGAFVRDASGEVLVAHRGKLSRGRAALKVTKVLREFGPSVVEANDNGKTTRLIVIASLDDPRLRERLFDFALEARDVATRLGIERTESAGSRNSGVENSEGQGLKSERSLPSRRASAPARAIKLRKYFDEYSGRGKRKGSQGGERVVLHGAIVKALAAAVGPTGKPQKAEAIDLAVIGKKATALYEVKTSARTTDVYGAVGQLFIHGESISELLGMSVERFLVLPERPNREHERHITGRGGMKIVTYKRRAGGYEFLGL